MVTGKSGRTKTVRRRASIHWGHRAVLGAVCVLVTSVFVWSANSGMLELLGSSAQDSYYNLLVQGFRAGQLNLKTDVPQGLARLPDPYVPNANAPYRLAAGHPLWDTSYYKGKLFIYFGPTPALVLLWPYAALTGHYLLHRDAVVIFFSIGFLASVALLYAMWRRYFAEVSFGAVLAGALALGLVSFAPLVLQRCDVYEVAIGCGYGLVMISLLALWRALHEPQRPGWWLAAASLIYGLAVASRPSLLFGAIMLLVPVVQAGRAGRPVWALLLAAVGPLVFIGLGLMVYNDLRFDSPFEFGLHYQLAGARQDTMQQFSLRYLWSNLRVGFLAPARWSGRFPFVQDIAVPPLPNGGSVEHAFGVLTNVPLVWLALAAPLAWRSQPANERSMVRWFLAAVALLFGLNALTLCLHISMCLRYEVEFLATLTLLAVIGVLGLERALVDLPRWRLAARLGWGLLLAFSVTFNLLASYALHGDAECNAGNALAQKGQMDAAVAHYRAALEIQPNHILTHYYLGSYLLQNGSVDEAITHLQQAVMLNPNSSSAHYELGKAFVQKSRVDEGIAECQKALEIKLDYPEAHNLLGNVFFRGGQVDEAITHYRAVLELEPDLVTVRCNLAYCLLQKGLPADAIVHFQKVLEIEPDNAGAQSGLASALFQQGQMSEALVHFENALKLQPQNVSALNNSAWVLATCPEASIRDGTRAVALAQQANQLTGGDNPVILNTLAAAYAEAGRFAEAVTTAGRALQLATNLGNAPLLNALQTRLDLYRAGSPFRDSVPATAPAGQPRSVP